MTTNDRNSTGIEGLDTILDGGFSKNRLFLIEGMPGSGKTTLAMQFLLDGISRGKRPSTSRCPRPRKSFTRRPRRTDGRSTEFTFANWSLP